MISVQKQKQSLLNHKKKIWGKNGAVWGKKIKPRKQKRIRWRNYLQRVELKYTKKMVEALLLFFKSQKKEFKFFLLKQSKTFLQDISHIDKSRKEKKNPKNIKQKKKKLIRIISGVPNCK